MIKEEKIVADILKDVLKHKDRAVVKYTKRFDKVFIPGPQIKAKKEEIQEAIKSVDKEFIASLKMAIRNITKYHVSQKPKTHIQNYPDDVTIGLRALPIESVGIYVPGGRAAYPSSVLMNAIPAKIAGVKKIVLVSPPNESGKINPYILAAAAHLKIKEIYKVGGAQGIAALAYGTKYIPKVDKIVGPGNIFVTSAKKMLFGTVGIDKLAGPSDVVIIADKSANPKFIAKDMMAQAEHDPISCSILITDSKEIEREAKKILNESKYFTQCKFYSVSNIDQALCLSNKIAPEHLELLIENPQKFLNRVENAGAIFLGEYTPVAVGDYIAGPNHVLPTDGSSRFSSPLGVYDFIKYQSVIKYSKKALSKVRVRINKLANIEGLKNHAGSVEVRF